MPRLAPSATAIAVGAGAAWMRKTDVDKARTTLSKQWGTYFEIGIAASGMIADLLRLGVNRDITDAASISGLALTSERLARSAMSGGGFGTGSPNRIANRSYAGAPMMYVPPSNNYPAAFAQKEKSATVY